MSLVTEEKAKKTNASEMPKRTYKSQITFNEHGQYYLELIGNFYGELRNQDYASLLTLRMRDQHHLLAKNVEMLSTLRN